MLKEKEERNVSTSDYCLHFYITLLSASFSDHIIWPCLYLYMVAFQPMQTEKKLRLRSDSNYCVDLLSFVSF